MTAGQVFKSRRLFIIEINTKKKKFLVNTGVNFFIWPSIKNNLARRHEFLLYAANGSAVPTYGEKLITLFGLRHEFIWPFIVAAVTKPILGADFLHHFGLIVDSRTKRLMDAKTNLSTTDKLINYPLRLAFLLLTKIQNISIY